MSVRVLEIKRVREKEIGEEKAGTLGVCVSVCVCVHVCVCEREREREERERERERERIKSPKCNRLAEWAHVNTYYMDA